MRFLLLFIFSLFGCWVLAQDTLNQVDQNGLKQGHWIYFGKDRPESGIPSDGKVEEGRYIDGKKEGIWIKYHTDGKTPKIKGEYHMNRPVGSYTKGSNPTIGKNDQYAQYTIADSLVYYVIKGCNRPEYGAPAEGLIEEGYYKNDRREGKCIKYHTDGKTPKMIGFYVNNRPSGLYQKFFESGKLKERGFFYKNVYRDSLKRFYENGQLEYEGFYDSIGNEQGRVNYYFESGKLEYTYFAVNGRPKNTIHLSEKGDTIYERKGFEDPCGYSPTIKRSEPNLGKKAPAITLPPNTKAVKWLPNNYNKVYNGDNEIWQDGIFKEGQLWDGKVYVYYRDGILLQVEIYKSGFYHSDGQL